VTGMAFLGLFGNTHAMATTTYASRESASDRKARKDAEASARRAARHRRESVRVSRRVSAQEDANRRAERTGTASRKRGWW